MTDQPTCDPIRIAVLVSGKGRGTNFQALIDGCKSGEIHGTIELLVSTTPDTPAMERAREGGVEGVYLPCPTHRGGGDDLEDQLDQALLALLLPRRIDLICLAGFMRKIGPRVLSAYSNQIMNIHPSLMPAFCGPGMFGRHVHEAVLDYGACVTGCTVQFIAEDYDSGPIILQRAVPVHGDDTPDTLGARVLCQEHRTYVEACRLFAEHRIRVVGRQVDILPGPHGEMPNPLDAMIVLENK